MLSRRRLLTCAAAGSALALPLPLQAAIPRARFPHDFLWGASTSALQIEGALDEDGRGPSIWESFASRPGAIRDGSTPAVTCDHYHRWREDVALMGDAGLNAYRFSIAWPRVLPRGRGAVNAAGLDFYDRLADALLAVGVRPMACLYHWDLPQPLQDDGGWLNRDIAGWFADYAAVVAHRLGDRIQDWFALNEPSVHAIFGHAQDQHAPGLNAGKSGLLAALHHQNLAQGHALRALQAERASFRLGTALSLQPVIPATDSDDDHRAAARWDAVWNRVSLDGVMRGLPPDILAEDMAPLVRTGDWETIRFPLDMLGVNYYSPLLTQNQPGSLFDAGGGGPVARRTTAMGWRVQPDGLYMILKELKTLYGNPRVVITENGAAYDDHPEADGRVHDADRIAFLHDHLLQVARARAEGCRVEGFLAWSLLDNWEWQFGHGPRFGLVRVDYDTQARQPKDSFAWFAHVARTELL